MAKLTVSSSPHIRKPVTTQRVMLDVIIALIPSLIAGIVIFGWRALAVAAVCVGTSVLSEFLFNLITRKERTIGDLSAVVTGLILALSIHVNAPIWQCILGSIFAIVVVKCFFGGIGCNFANPAATSRVFLLICFTNTLGGFKQWQAAADGTGDAELVSLATPLEMIAKGGELPSLLDMFLGNRLGAIGESCMIALIIGFIYLVARRVIHFETPLIYVGTVFVLSLIVDNSFEAALYQVMAGGLVYAAVFMITDYVTTPITRSGKMIFALGCGIITFLIRYFGNYPEGVSFAILIMNIVSPYIERLTARRPLGAGGKKK